MRPSLILALALISVTIFAVFQVKYKVRDLTRELKEVERQLAIEKEVRHVLRAEWAYLTRPDRIKRLSERYLKLKEVSVAQLHVMPDSGSRVLASGNSEITPTLRPTLSNARIVE